MIIALLAVLGVNLLVLVLLVGALLARRRYVSRRPGAFRGAARVAAGSVEGLGGRWSLGYGRWIRDVLVWTKGPVLLRTALVATDDLEQVRAAAPKEVRRLGKEPVVLSITAEGAVVQLATSRPDADVATGPHAAEWRERRRAGRAAT